MIIKELLVSLGFEYDDASEKEVDKFDQDVKDATANIAKLVAGTIAAGTAIVAFVGHMSGLSDELKKSSDLTGVAVENLDAWRHVADLATGSGAGMLDTMESLSKTMAELARGEGPVEAFGELGLDPLDTSGRLKDVDKFLLEISDKIASVSDRAERIRLAEKMGLGDLTLLLQKGSSEITKMIERAIRLGAVTEEEAAAGERFKDTLADVFFQIRKLGIIIAGKLQPLAESILGIVSKMVPIVKSLANTIGFLIEKIGGVEVALKFVLAVLGLLIAFNIGKLVMALIGGLQLLIPLITGTGNAALIANAKASAGLILIGALIAFIILLIEDIIVTARGGEGLLDNIVKKFPFIEDALMPIAQILRGVLDTVDLIIDTIENPNSEGWRKFLEKLGSIWADVAKEIFDSILRQMKRVIDLVNKIPGVNLDSGVLTPEGLNEAQEGLATGLLDLLGVNQQTSIPAGPTTNVSNGATTINVNGVTDPKAVANIVNQKLDERNKAGLRNLRSGVRQ